METPIRDWIDGLEREDRTRVLDALADDWELFGAVALALGPVGSPAGAAELRAAFLRELVGALREGETAGPVALRRALERAALEAVLSACDELS